MFLRINKVLLSLFSLVLLVGLFACSNKEEFSNNPVENYDALWKIIDERYSFLDYKLGNKSWKEMYHKYRPKVKVGMSEDALFDVMTKLLGELNDGHVNLVAPFDRNSFSSWSKDSEDYYRASILRKYIGGRYRIAGSLIYRVLDYPNHKKDSIGYMRCRSFSSSLSTMNIYSVLSRLNACKGLIIDLRNNGGGSLTKSNNLASFFTRKDRLVGYYRYKNGPAHDAFSEKEALIAKAGKYGVWLKPVIVLVNSGVYSAGNDFTLKMKGLKQVQIIGGKTGGGGGLPMSSELPNGWTIRYSSSQTFDLEGRNIEHGIEPDKHVLLQTDPIDGKEADGLIEEAVRLIKEMNQVKTKN